MTDEWYMERRRGIEQFFHAGNIAENTLAPIESPCGKYFLQIWKYKTKPGCWDYSRGIITALNGVSVADIRRNYPTFWYTWIDHPKLGKFLLCGEDYQGYSIIDLKQGQQLVHIPHEARKGYGFCWGNAYPSPSQELICVYGCQWATPWELRVYEFSTELPLKLVTSFKNTKFMDNPLTNYDCRFIGWTDENTIKVEIATLVEDYDGEQEVKIYKSFKVSDES